MRSAVPGRGGRLSTMNAVAFLMSSSINLNRSASREPTAEEFAARSLAFARERLGPASERRLTDPALQVLVISRLRGGFDLEDAVLAEMHRVAATDRDVANEFIAHFLNDLLKIGHRLRSSAVQRFLDTGDLVQSMIGDLWSDLSEVRFETRGRFLSYMAKRLGWKAVDRARQMRTQKRQEDRRVDAQPDDLDLSAGDGSPSMAAARSEDHERLALVLMRLSERDRRLLVLYMRGASLQDIASELGVSYDSARVGLQRAIRRARSLE